MPEVKRIPIAEFVRLGYLQELNRLFLHRLGLALEVVTDDDGRPVAFGGVWDCRSDPEGVAYGPGVLDSDAAREKAANVSAELSEKCRGRRRRLGFDVQPVPDGDDGLPQAGSVEPPPGGR